MKFHRRWVHSQNKNKRKKLFLRMLPQLRKTAKKNGYALAVHGSLTRDFDLIAVPWVDKPSDPDLLSKSLVEAVCKFGMLPNKDAWESKPHGRKAKTFVIGFAEVIDLSVVPFLDGRKGSPDESEI